MPASVYTVNFFACRAGELTWEYPYGGVQVTFKSGVPLETKGTYHVCISSRNNGFDIFTRSKGNFKLLRGHNAKNKTSEICVNSKDKKVMIYLEAASDVKTKRAVFAYRTVFLGNGHGAVRQRDCRACSRQELIKSFCAGDFGKCLIKSFLAVIDVIISLFFNPSNHSF